MNETKKTWTFEMIQYPDNSITVNRTNAGFNIFELIGLLETALKELHNVYNKTFEQNIDVVKRTVITD